MRLYRISLRQGPQSWIVAGVKVENGTIVRTAPILKWSLGKPLRVLERWVRDHRGEIQEFPLEHWYGAETDTAQETDT
jgi:hypothetical protein